jgi:hypothetical protein
LLAAPYVFDIRSMFGLTLPGGTEPRAVIFANGNSPQTIQFAEWRTASPVTVTQVVVYAQGQDASWDYARQYKRLTLRAKSAGSDTFDVELFSCPPPHPPRPSLTVTNIAFVTASEFRAEFLPYATTSSGPPYGVRNGCRVTELDAFGTLGAPAMPTPTVDLQTYAGIRIEGTPGRTYCLEHAASVDSAVWMPLTNIVLPQSPFTVMDSAPISMPKRLYRAVEVPLP